MRWVKKRLPKNKTNDIYINVKNEDINFTDVMFLDIAEMKLKLENIKSEPEVYTSLQILIEDFEKYIEKAAKLMEERRIEEKLQRINESNIILEINPHPEIPQSIKDRVTQELTIEDYYKNIKAVYDVKYKNAMQSILMRRLEKFNLDMDEALYDEEKLNTIDLNELKTYFKILKAQKEEFSGIMQNQYISRLMELEYRIYIIEMVEAKRQFAYISENLIEEFKHKAETTKSKQRVWSRLFVVGIRNLIEDGNAHNSEKLKKGLERINLQGKGEEILDLEVIIEYIFGIIQAQRVKSEKREEQERINKEQEEKERLQEELKQYKDLTPKQIEEKIKQLDNNKFDIVASYRDIINYQIKVAKAKGLINERNILRLDDIEIVRTKRQKIPAILENLRKVVYNCEIYTDVDNSENGIFIVTPKKEGEKLIKLNHKVNKDETFNVDYRPDWTKYKATEDFMKLYDMYYKSNSKPIIFVEDGMCVYGYNESAFFERVRRFKEQWEKENEDNVNRIKFYIEIPYRRTIIPILEELSQNDIEFTIPPIDENTKMNTPTVRIYMNREDLKRYKEKVHGKISNPNNGVAVIGEENIDIGELLIEGCEIPFLEEREQR